MKFTWFATFQGKGDLTVPVDELAWLSDIIAKTPGMTQALVYTPWAIDGLHYDDGPSPHLQLQLYFDTVDDMECAIGKTGHLQAIAQPGALPSLSGAKITEQAMVVRAFPVSDAPNPKRPYCTYLVHYPGPAQDMNAWLQHYIDGHTPVMRRFPGIRGVEVCSCMDWCSALGWNRVAHMQRNKVVFDDADALKAALASSVMQEMRADLGAFPPFAGGNAHFPMRTVQIDGCQR